MIKVSDAYWIISREGNVSIPIVIKSEEELSRQKLVMCNHITGTMPSGQKLYNYRGW